MALPQLWGWMLTSCLAEQSEIICYSSEQIHKIWPHVMEYVMLGLGERNLYTLPRVYKGLENGELQLWTAQTDEIEAVIVTSIQTDTEGNEVKFCLVLSAGGTNIDSWIDSMVLYIESWAKENGCSEMRIYGRRGWARKVGYTIEYTKMVKQLCE